MIPTPKKRGRKRKQIIIDNSEPMEKRRNIRIIKAVKKSIGGTDYYVSGETIPFIFWSMTSKWNDAPLSDSARSGLRPMFSFGRFISK